MGKGKAGVLRRTDSKLNDVSPRSPAIFLHLVMGGSLCTAVELLQSETSPAVGLPSLYSKTALEQN